MGSLLISAFKAAQLELVIWKRDFFQLKRYRLNIQWLFILA